MPEIQFPTKYSPVDLSKKTAVTYLDKYKLKINDILVEINIVL